MDKIGKLWTFGDSFTYNFELQEKHKYYKFKPTDGKPYVNWLADKFNLELVNLGTPGWGNTHILYDLLRFAHLFSEEDYIIVGASDSMRVQSFEYQNFRTSFCQASFSWVLDEYDTNMAKEFISNRFPESLTNYIVECRLPLSNQHTLYDLTMLLNVLKLVKGAKKALWTTRMWGKFETITQHTDGEIQDMHWSWNGHKDFALHLESVLSETDFYIDPYIDELKKDGKYLEDPLDYERIIPKLTV